MVNSCRSTNLMSCLYGLRGSCGPGPISAGLALLAPSASTICRLHFCSLLSLKKMTFRLARSSSLALSQDSRVFQILTSDFQPHIFSGPFLPFELYARRWLRLMLLRIRHIHTYLSQMFPPQMLLARATVRLPLLDIRHWTRGGHWTAGPASRCHRFPGIDTDKPVVRLPFRWYIRGAPAGHASSADGAAAPRPRVLTS